MLKYKISKKNVIKFVSVTQWSFVIIFTHRIAINTMVNIFFGSKEHSGETHTHYVQRSGELLVRTCSPTYQMLLQPFTI
jgi:hypothetical protein